MNERLKQIRKSLNMTQASFAESMRLATNYIYLMENGKSPVSDKVVFMVCNLYNINEEWLRTGEGEMHPPKTRADEVAEIASTLMKDDTSPLKAKFINAITKMTDEQMEVFLEVAKELLEETSLK